MTNRRTDIFKYAITVSTVTNTADPADIVPDSMARMAAASIALTGRYTITIGDLVKHWQQY